MKVIRWLNAFANSRQDIAESLSYELGNGRVKAAEVIEEESSVIEKRSVRVGLLVKEKAVVKTYRCDVWSVRTRRQNLKPTRFEAYSFHKEAFIKPSYEAIVLRCKVKDLSMKEIKALLWANKVHGLGIVDERSGKDLLSLVLARRTKGGSM